MVFISETDASNDSSISISSGIDSSYDMYVILFTNIHPSSDVVDFEFQVNASGQSGYNEQVQSTYGMDQHKEDGTSGTLFYVTGRDQANGTSYQEIGLDVGADNDQHASGYMILFNPSGTTFSKHWICRMGIQHNGDYMVTVYTGGYFNFTAALDDIAFRFNSGNIQSGNFKLYGVGN